MSFEKQSTGEFTKVLASQSPVPGGGGASAMVGAIGVSLAAMVGNLTTGKKKYAQYEPDIQRILSDAENLRCELLRLIDDDAACFEPLSRAYSIPKDDPNRAEIMESSLRNACTAPLNIMKAACKAIELHAELEEKGSKLMQSDVAVGILCCKTALQGASVNIFINLSSMTDDEYASKLCAEVNGLLEKYVTLANDTYEKVLAKLI